MPAVTKAPARQWWLSDGAGGSRLADAWTLATGHGVTVGLIDSQVNEAHADLAGRVSLSSPVPLSVLPQPGDNHGTQVAGLIAGRTGNGIAGTGAAPDSQLHSFAIDYAAPVDLQALSAHLAAQAAFDVSNNSWGLPQAFADSFMTTAGRGLKDALDHAVTAGRDGLGTVFVFAAGNGRMDADGVNRGDDVNFHNLANSRRTIAVGATDDTGNAAFFSSPGTSLLLSAPGTWLLTASGSGTGDKSFAQVSGTSFAAPLVSGTVALMLQVNPKLGYRDVQEILAISARPSADADAVGNGAGFVNGGGLVHAREMGFGLLDAEAAVRLARHWKGQATAGNEAEARLDLGSSLSPDPLHEIITGTVVQPDHGFRLDWVELTLTLADQDLRDLRIELISPSGTRSVIAENLNAAGNRTYLNFTFTSAVHWGEDIGGEWRVELAHPDGSQGFTVYKAALTFYGDADSADDVHFLTRSFGALLRQDQTRGHIIDGDGGFDTLNISAAGHAAVIDLGSRTGQLGSDRFLIDGFEAVIGGHKADVLTGTGAANSLVGDFGADRLRGGGGADTLSGSEDDDHLWGGSDDDRLEGGSGRDRLNGGTGDDWLEGGAGRDILSGGTGADVFVLSASGPPDRIADFTPGEDRLLISAPGIAPGELAYDPSTGLFTADPDGHGGHPSIRLAWLPAHLAFDLTELVLG